MVTDLSHEAISPIRLRDTVPPVPPESDPIPEQKEKDVRSEPDYIALIDRRVLERECLANSLVLHQINRTVLTFSTIDEWKAARAKIGIPLAVLYNSGSAQPGRVLFDEIQELVDAVAPAAVVILSDNHEVNAMLDTIAQGVRGYIPSSVSIDVCIQAISLAIAGGRFIPASSIMNMRELRNLPASKPVTKMKFTDRQSAVAEALRYGKANKDIASELNLCESTIKVHIRNIMKKLGATNRTEVACKIGDMVCGN